MQAWNTTGDSYSVNPGDKPWISEMYGYSYACSAADVWHKVDFSAMLYPAYFSASRSFCLFPVKNWPAQYHGDHAALNSMSKDNASSANSGAFAQAPKQAGSSGLYLFTCIYSSAKAS